MDIVRTRRVISFPRAGDRLLLVRFHDRCFLFFVWKEIGRGGITLIALLRHFPRDEDRETTIFRFF